ncbi:hypothetical protein MVEG_09863 [Podila verticillata NRRL 6337]|nr:hypothetical protein MVEG_09863 [Podila verticillata NRRL 6337]
MDASSSSSLQPPTESGPVSGPSSIFKDTMNTFSTEPPPDSPSQPLPTTNAPNTTTPPPTPAPSSSKAPVHSTNNTTPDTKLHPSIPTTTPEHNVTNNSPHKTFNSGKAFGFLGSLSPKSSRQKLKQAQGHQKHASLPGSPQCLFATSTSSSSSPVDTLASEATSSGSPGRLFRHGHSNSSSSASSPQKGSTEMTESRETSFRSNLGQRLSIAMGLSSESKLRRQASRRRDMQESVDSLSTIATHRQAVSEDSVRPALPSSPASGNRRGGGGIINHLWTRPRVFSASESPTGHKGSFLGHRGSKSQSKFATIASSVATTGGTSASATNSDVSAESHASTEQDEDGRRQSRPHSRQSWIGHGARNESNGSSDSQKMLHNRGNSGNSGRPFVERIHRRGVRTQQYLAEVPPNFADIVETSGEIHPHHTGEDIERVNLYSHLGMQEMHYNSLNDSSDSITQQLHRNERPQPTILTAIPQISNSTSSPSMSSGSSGPTAKGSRLGKLGRFKLFPSLSMGSIHKSKSSTGTLTQPSSSAVSRDSHQMSTASADDSSQPGNISISPISPTLEESTGASLPDPDVDAEETESTRLGAAMSISGSASTFASVGTVNMMIAASSGSSSNSSISSNYNTFEVGFGRKPRQSLAVFLEQHKHMEGSGGTRQPSISSTVAPRTLTEGALNPASHDSAPMSGSKDRSNERESRRSIFGSERVTNGHGVFRSGILKRSSRRTVSASHISPSNIFAPVKGSDAPMATCSSGTHKTGRCNCGQAVKHFCSERDIQTAARLQALMAQDMDTEETGTDEGEGRVGRYLFGNELSNMSFGDSKEPDSQNQMSMEVLTSVPLEETTTLDDSSVTLEPVILNVASMAAPNLGKQVSMPTLIVSTRKEIGPRTSSMDSTPPSSISSSTSASSATSTSSNKTITPQSIASSLAAQRSLISKGLKHGDGKLLPLTTGDHSKDGAKGSQPKTASSFGSTRSKFSFPGSSISSTSSSSSRPSIFHHQVFSGATPTIGSTTTFSTSPSSYIPSPYLSSSAPQRPSSPPNDRQSTSTSNSSSLKYSSKQRPQLPYLEPRSAVAEYTSSCSSIVYKKQRSMSLQDADLLTADQFIALMPDEITAKRRFSSEEKPGENTWHATAKRVTTPDPATTLHSLMSTLKVTCGNILDQLATVLAPLSNGSVPSSTSTTTFSTTPPSSNSLSSEVSTTPESNRSERETAPSSNREQVQPKILIRVEATSDVEDGEHGQSDTAASNNEGRASDIPRHRTQPIAIKKPTMLQHATQEHGSLASSNMFPNFDQQDLVETIWILFDDLEQVVIKMLNILKKYIATDQFAKLLQESDEMGELSQQIFRAEMDRRERWIEQQLDQEIESKIGAHRTEDSVDDSNRSGAFNGQAREASSIHPTERPRRALHANDHLAQTSDQINGANRSGNGNHAEQGHSHLPLHFGDTKGTTTGITNRIRHRRSRDHVRVEPFCRPQDETVKDESSSLEGKQDIVRDYIRTLLEMAEISVAEYMRTYNRFLIVPTAGYRIEGCNDNKKIERAAAALSGLSRGRRSSLFMPSSTTSPPSLLQQSLLTKMSGRGYQEPTEVEGTDSSRTDASETRVSMTSMASQSSSDLALTQSQFGGGHAMVRVKSLPESKDEWAALQKRKEMGSGAGVGEAIAMGMAPTPSVTSGPSPIGIGGGAGGIGPIGAVGVGDMGGRILPSDLSMMGDYSKEHMGHEAYYYRNWFLGKEHRTFVGQVEGLGTVIISIIKDMVVPTEARQTIPVFRSNTGPGAISHSSTPTAFGAAISGPFNGVSAGHPRPELVHSAQSYYPGRGGQSFSPVGSITGRSGGLTATPRTSSEAMRVILSSSANNSSASGSAVSGEAGASSSTSSAQNTAGSTPSTLASSANYFASHGTSTSPARWQYRCILRQKDVDSLRITLPEPEPSPLNNLTRRTGKPQWKTILQSIHPAITQQVASKLKKVQNNQHFEKELATFDETMLRFNYKFGVLLVQPGQKHEEDWFGNQTGASARFQEFLESGTLGQKVALKGFERFSAGLDTRLGETGEHSYFDTWGDGFEIMYHVSTMLPFNTLDPQQIQRKRHIGNDIVCIVFVDGDQPFVPNAIKSQFLHIFVIVHPITLPDGTRGYSATIACDEQVPEFGPPLPDPPIFRNPVELRAFLLCKMINGENAAYKAPRLIKPHQRARSGLLENLVAKANTLAKDSSKKQKAVSQASISAATSTAGYSLPMHRLVLLRSAPAIVISPINTIASTSATITIIRLRAFPGFLLIRMDIQYATPPNRR